MHNNAPKGQAAMSKTILSQLEEKFQVLIVGERFSEFLIHHLVIMASQVLKYDSLDLY